MRIHRPYPLFPLPQDYESLTLDGQRQARLAVLSDHWPPYKLVLAWDLFRRLYLAQTKEAVFYKNGFKESPDFHSDMVFDMSRYGRNAYAAPRGSAKSTVIAVEMSLLLSLSRPFYEIILALSTDKQVEERFDHIMMQLEQNELILQDFGEMKPKRGQGLWNHHHLHLNNGSILKGLSVMGKKRGGRPRLFILDDPENDPDSDSETSRLAIIERFETILFKQIIPMLEYGSSCFWIGTLIDRKAFLYRAVMGDDPRFDYWNRKVLKAISYDKEDPTKCYLLWPSKWPRDVLEARREEIGSAAFHSEYCNDPISAQERLLVVDERKNEYTVEGEFNWAAPLANTNIVKWNDRIFGDDNDHRTYKEMERKYNELVGPMFRVLLFDYASGLTSYHDYACIAVCGFDMQATMWLLYGWLGRAKDDTLMRLIYETGLIWQVKVIGIEAVSIQKSFAEAAREYMSEQAGMRGDSWRPRTFGITYPAKESKGQRIASSLEWRFNSGRIKYPAHLKDRWPYNQAYAQTADFTLDLALLQHDDFIDTLGMHKYVIKTKGNQFKRERGVPNLRERIIKNQPEVPGLPVLSGVSSKDISNEMMNIMSQQRRRRNIQPPQRRIERQKPKIIR
jgi:hypothetical protein